MEVQGNGIFVFPRKGLGLEGTEVITGKLAALLFVSQEQGESEGAQMLPAELVWWSHRMKPPSLALGYSEPAQGQGTTKGTHYQRLHCSSGPQHLSIPQEDPPKSHPMATPVLGPFGALEGWHLHRAKPHLSLSFWWEGEESQGPCEQGGCWYLLEALVGMEGGASPSCCPCAPHQTELAGNVGLSLPAQGQRLCSGCHAVLQVNDCSQLPPLPAPPALPACASTYLACLYPGESLGCSEGHVR